METEKRYRFAGVGAALFLDDDFGTAYDTRADQRRVGPVMLV